MQSVTFDVLHEVKSNVHLGIFMKPKKIKAEKREKKKKQKMAVFGKSVFGLQRIIIKKAKKDNKTIRNS